MHGSFGLYFWKNCTLFAQRVQSFLARSTIIIAHLVSLNEFDIIEWRMLLSLKQSGVTVLRHGDRCRWY